MEKEHVGKITTITHTLRKISRWNKVIIPQHLLQFALFFDCGTCWLCHSGLPKVNQHVACRSWMPHFPYFAICDLPLKVTAPWPDHTPGICATQISCTRKQSNTDRGWWPESRGQSFYEHAMHILIKWQAGWVTNKLGLLCLLCKYAGQIDLLRRRRIKNGGGYYSQLCQQDGKQNAAYAQFQQQNSPQNVCKYLTYTWKEDRRHTPYAT